jgi:uncharacterized membrane protein
MTTTEMQEFLRHICGWVCGQNPAHTWMPGGEWLPLCQRCTGLYVGALVAGLLQVAWRPAPTLGWRWLNGLFLLFMLPSGLYWIPQNPELRCGSGILFGFGLVAFLSLTLPAGFAIYDIRFTRRLEIPARRVNRKSQIVNVAGLLATLVLVPVLAENGNTVAAGMLTAACIGGALVLAALLLANAFLLLRWLEGRGAATAA